VEGHEIITASDLKHLEGKFEELLENNFRVIGLNFKEARDEALLVHDADVQKLRHSLLAAENIADTQTVVNEWYSAIALLPIDSILGPVERAIAVMAEKRGKKVIFRLIGCEIKVDPIRYGDLLLSLIHLMHRALDHDIENHSRLANKIYLRQITLSFKMQGFTFIIEIEDNDSDIDTQQLGERVAALRGSIHFTTAPGEGTSCTIEIPPPVDCKNPFGAASVA
jgi:chemotaxis protein histidine kinase CheA